MSKATIIISDGEDGTIDVKVEFSPPLKPGVVPSRAQEMAYEFARLLSGSEGTPEDEAYHE